MFKNKFILKILNSSQTAEIALDSLDQEQAYFFLEGLNILNKQIASQPEEIKADSTQLTPDADILFVDFSDHSAVTSS